ncbi:LysR substrate-binding domain-containing protein [Rhodococcus triatomae]
MTLDQLRCFVAVARSGHFTRAADGLGIAQPSLSRQVAALERDVGARLFDRTPGAVTLSAAGETLLPVAVRMLEDRDAAYRRIEELTGLARGRLRIGATPSLCTSLIPDVIERYHDAHPGVDLHITEAGSGTLTESLAQGELDLALVIAERAVRNPALDLIPLLSEELVVVSSADRPALTRRRAVTLSEVAGHALVLCHDGYDLRVALDRAFQDAGLQPHIVVEGAELDAVLRFVARGIGVTVAPVTATLHYPGLRATRLTSPGLTRTIGLARRGGIDPSHAAVAFHSVLRECVVESAEGTTGLTLRIPDGAFGRTGRRSGRPHDRP